MAADEHQGSVAPRSIKRSRNQRQKAAENNDTAADTRPPKRQKVDRRAGNVQPEGRRSARATKLTERAKEAK